MQTKIWAYYDLSDTDTAHLSFSLTTFFNCLRICKCPIMCLCAPPLPAPNSACLGYRVEVKEAMRETGTFFSMERWLLFDRRSDIPFPLQETGKLATATWELTLCNTRTYPLSPQKIAWHHPICLKGKMGGKEGRWWHMTYGNGNGGKF